MWLDNLNPFGQFRPTMSFAEGEGGGTDSGEGTDTKNDDTDDTTTDTATVTMSDWKANLDPTLRNHPSIEKFKTVGDLAKSHIEVQKLIGREKIPMPAKPYKDSPKDYDMVFDRLGRPSDPKSYKIPELEYGEGMTAPTEQEITDFKTIAHQIGLLPHQVEALYQFNHARNKNANEQYFKQRETQLQEAETQLRRELGKNYDAEIGNARKLLRKFGNDDVLSMVENTGIGNNSAFIKMMIDISKHFGEDGSFLSEPAPSNILTPEEANKKISEIRNDKKHPYHNKLHSEHKEAVAYMQSLYRMAYPSE